MVRRGRPAWVPLPVAPEPPTCPTCSGEMFRGHYDEWTCAACWRHVRAASENASLSIQRDFDPEGTLREPDRSDDREQVIYEGTTKSKEQQ